MGRSEEVQRPLKVIKNHEEPNTVRLRLETRQKCTGRKNTETHIDVGLEDEGGE